MDSTTTPTEPAPSPRTPRPIETQASGRRVTTLHRSPHRARTRHSAQHPRRSGRQPTTSVLTAIGALAGVLTQHHGHAFCVLSQFRAGIRAPAVGKVDELHNVLAGRGDVRREFLNLIRFLGNELRIPLVGVGTREAYLAIRSDDQLENRSSRSPCRHGIPMPRRARCWPASPPRSRCAGRRRSRPRRWRATC
jgi:hypothetical protein